MFRREPRREVDNPARPRRRHRLTLHIGAILQIIRNDLSHYPLVTLGSDELQKKGYTRQGLGAVVGPMPPMGPIIKDSDDLWKILAFIRSRYDGDPGYKYGTPATPQ